MKDEDEFALETGWFTMIDQNLAVPFETTVLGMLVTVERIDLNASEQIVAICRHHAGQRRPRERGAVEVRRSWPR